MAEIIELSCFPQPVVAMTKPRNEAAANIVRYFFMPGFVVFVGDFQEQIKLSMAITIDFSVASGSP
jgi:hypothetical protein